MGPSGAAPVPAPAPGPASRAIALAARGISPERVRTVIAHILECGSTVTLDEVLTELEAHPGVAPEDDTRRLHARLAEHRDSVLLVGDEGYPPHLAQAWPELGAPLWLFARTPRSGLPTGPAVAIVGSRRPTLEGVRVARELARQVANHGITVVSGLARGIDQAAHLGALDADGATIAVLGTGFDVDYPRGDGTLRAAVAAAGGLVTEYLPGTPPRPQHFLWRNRIVAGLADLTVVVEGGARSGSLQTARLAAAQGRDVWAVPGPLRAPSSAAPLALIRDGAHVVTRISDVIDAMGKPPSHGPRSQGPGGAQTPPALGGASARVHGLLGGVPATASALSTAADLPVPTVSAILADLSDRGLAVVTPHGAVAAHPAAGALGTADSWRSRDDGQHARRRS